jgi:hypothetical protein
MGRPHVREGDLEWKGRGWSEGEGGIGVAAGHGRARCENKGGLGMRTREGIERGEINNPLILCISL